MLGFLIDQQLPARLARYFKDQGHSARHIKEYPGGPTLSDVDITRIADAESWAVVTKDEDFRITHLLKQQPARLLHITCGNIATPDLLELIQKHRDELFIAMTAYRYVELTRSGVVVHDTT